MLPAFLLMPERRFLIKNPALRTQLPREREPCGLLLDPMVGVAGVVLEQKEIAVGQQPGGPDRLVGGPQAFDDAAHFLVADRHDDRRGRVERGGIREKIDAVHNRAGLRRAAE